MKATLAQVTPAQPNERKKGFFLFVTAAAEEQRVLVEHRTQSPGHCGQDSSKTTSKMWSGRAEKDRDVSLGDLQGAVTAGSSWK